MNKRNNPIKMIDISDKKVVHREAVATGRINLRGDTIEKIRSGRIKKGDPLPTAEVACILAVKKTPDILPLCHPIPITSVDAEFQIKENYIEARCRVAADYKTGVEMEALTGVSVALLTLWDMVKYLEKDTAGQYPSTIITDVMVMEKRKH
ncbi:cyclic pyranopterin monophosphate synthase MoaC [Candidatus Bathyarchaeota archaeon]|nr:cyclic pyranopterin monophosphate synthase MoaC [Candidatus Bathyarchaeota archaeon]MDP6048132.1 cyclic pyranopterin monophosphate synthase MoaC [Candidatus Bathyarchaeota archaeon]MDP7443967.1 cyclic pyranopterin monophosphate synthase MoaC [Candidatus Bathyarchaeota archaeon]